MLVDFPTLLIIIFNNIKIMSKHQSVSWPWTWWIAMRSNGMARAYSYHSLLAHGNWIPDWLSNYFTNNMVRLSLTLLTLLANLTKLTVIALLAWLAELTLMDYLGTANNSYLSLAWRRSRHGNGVSRVMYNLAICWCHRHLCDCMNLRLILHSDSNFTRASLWLRRFSWLFLELHN